MRPRRFALRLLIALLGVVQGFAPGAASIVDARPAALAMSERTIVHFEEPGTEHIFAHDEECVLCQAATQLAGVPLPAPAFEGTALASWPARGAWLARNEATQVAHLRTRAPPA